ncbi:MAG: hypothetical protein R3301_12685 [Saprospiraceae bacterium]|nr:hypothetical protein [Saprospiraceae bacterium]
MTTPKRSLALAALLGMMTPLGGQSISAVIANQTDGGVVADAFVFIANTSIGTISGQDGRFELDISAVAEREEASLVVSHLNYATQTLEPSALRAMPDTIYLEPAAVSINEVVVARKGRGGLRARRMKAFRTQFIGTGRAAQSVKITNPDVLLFSEEHGALHASATAPLQLSNEWLGYDIEYFLKEFESYPSGDVRYAGSAFFREKEVSPRERARYHRNRSTAYHQTSRKFFAALVSGTLDTTEYAIGYATLDHRLEVTGTTPLRANALPILPLEGDRYEIRLSGILAVHVLGAPRKKGQPSTGEQVTTPYGQQTTTRLYLPITYYNARTRKIIVNRYGTILNPKDIEEFGYWAQQRTAYLLPFTYQPE